MICEYLPTVPSLYATACGGLVSAILWCFGEINLSVQWLFIFCVIDYFTGTLASCKEHHWNSRSGSKGIIKKVIMFLIVAMAHGIDVSLNCDYIREATIITYMINEIGSIIENVERLGYENAVPPILKSAIKSIARKQNNIVKSIEKDE